MMLAVLEKRSGFKLSTKDVFLNIAGEIGLSGEIRTVSHVENRISEAEKLGFEKIVLSKYSLKNINLKRYTIEVIAVSKIMDIVDLLL